MIQDARGRAKPLAPLILSSNMCGIEHKRPKFEGHAHIAIESSDEEDEPPTREAVAWAVEQLPDSEVAHVRAALAKVPWLGKAWRPRWQECQDGPVGSTGALSFFGGPPKQV